MSRNSFRVKPAFLRSAGVVLLALVLMLSALPVAAVPTRPAEPSITAYSAIVMDYDTGEVLYEKDAHTARVPASMTKVMTAYIIMEELESGRLTLDTQVPVSANAARISVDASYPTAVPLTAGSTLSVDMLLKLILLPSASACCIVMAEYISGSEEAFVERMNETARSLRLNAAYQNCHGARVHYISAHSQALLVRKCIQRFPQILDYTSMTSVWYNGQSWGNTNQLLPGGAYSYAGADGFKTGTITEAGYCLSATAVRDGRRVISVVMRSSSTATRHTDSIALLDYGFQVLADMADYRDVTYHWARESVEQLDAMGIELHAQDGLFRPDAGMTRAEFAAMLCSALDNRGLLTTGQADAENVAAVENVAEKENVADEESEENAEETDSVNDAEAPAPGFTDVSGHWAESYIEPLARMGLIVGSEGRFNPDRSITRQEIMVILDRALDLPERNGLGYSDDGQISLWALEAAARATAAGLFTGSNGLLRPAAPATRAEGAVLIRRVLRLLPA